MTLTTSGRIGSPFTSRDLEGFPDDGNRYELSYGSLIVTPSPNTRHQAIATAVAAFLHARAPSSQVVLLEAELAVQEDLVKRPDVQVVSKDLVGGQSVVGVPALVVEVHSPATRVLDLTEKRFVYAQTGIPAYWMVDPDASTLTVLELKDGAYIEVAVVNALDSVDLTVPFAMKVEGPAIFGT